MTDGNGHKHRAKVGNLFVMKQNRQRKLTQDVIDDKAL